MSERVAEMQPADAGRWDAFVESCPDATFFHRAGWKTVIERSFGHRPTYLYAERNGAIVGVLPLVHIKSRLFGNALISNGYCMGGGPAAVDEAAYAALDAHAVALLEETGADYLEYRQPARRHPDWAVRDDLYATFSRPMAAAEDDNLKQIPRKQRAVVRKALQGELQDVVETDAAALYDLYARSVRNLGTPVFARRYFDNLLSVFGRDCDILTVRYGGTPLASVISFYFRDRVMPYYTGAREEARRLGANDLMYWRLMRRAVARGYTVFDFGRSKVGTGPYAFKKNWGFEPVPVIHEYKLRPGAEMPNVNPTNPKYRLFIALWQRLPLPVANRLGPHIVRNIG